MSTDISPSFIAARGRAWSVAAPQQPVSAKHRDPEIRAGYQELR